MMHHKHSIPNLCALLFVFNVIPIGMTDISTNSIKTIFSDQAGNEIESAKKNTSSEADISGLIFQPPFELTPPFIPSGGNELCQEHIKMYLRDLKAWENWALQMWDATGKLPSGLFSGHGNELGDFESCLSVAGPEEFSTNYCLAAIDLEIQDDAPQNVRKVTERILSDSVFKSSFQTPASTVPRFSTLGWGICVPKSCSMNSLELGLKQAFSQINSTAGLIVRTGIPKYSCYQERSPCNLATILTVLFFVIVIAIALTGTIMDVKYEGEEGKNNEKGILILTLSAFSVKRNLTDLLDECKDEFPFLHGIRAITTLIIFLIHRALMTCGIMFTFRSNFTKLTLLPFIPIIRSGPKWVDLFFLMSGFLTSSTLTKEIINRGHISWTKRVVKRWIRLTPPLLAVVLYYSYLMEYTGSGPQWQTFVTANADLCKSSSWKNLLYIQNFSPLEEMCTPQTHQISSDMVLFIIAPVFVLALYKNELFGFALIIAAGAASALSNYHVSYTKHISLYTRFGWHIEEFYSYMNNIQLRPFNNLIPYLSGVTVGYILNKYRNKLQFNKKAKAIGWALCIIGLVWSIMSQRHMSYPHHKYNQYEASLFAAISPGIFSSCLFWIILICAIEKEGKLQKILSSKFLLIISRLSYSIYLTQFIVFYYNIGSLKATGNISYTDLFHIWEFALVCLKSLFLYVLFENPMKAIQNIIFEGSSRKVKTN